MLPDQLWDYQFPLEHRPEQLGEYREIADALLELAQATLDLRFQRQGLFVDYGRISTSLTFQYELFPSVELAVGGMITLAGHPEREEIETTVGGTLYLFVNNQRVRTDEGCLIGFGIQQRGPSPASARWEQDEFGSADGYLHLEEVVWDDEIIVL